MSECEAAKGTDKSIRRAGAVIALMQTGVMDYATIARATGLSEEEIERIDAAQEDHIRQLAVQGTARDVYYHLRCKITCPRCGSIIYLVPCVACTVARSRRSSRGRRPQVAPQPPNPGIVCPSRCPLP
jgi:hypothetical protein